ncbi:MAG TPA: LptF/LptG family permease, partial [Candidatus Acidoferrales bacterium]|nr:LptF/LptG family permease [Candidatus Acidoferrales bacterium]
MRREHPVAAAFSRLTILDRYMLGELVGPFTFGLSAFTLILIATQLLAIAKFVTDEHAPLLIAIEYFLWGLPQVLIYVIPMALLLGVLLTMQRLSGDSEIIAMKAGGISLYRIVASLIVVGVLASFVSLFLQEEIVPIATDQAAYLREIVIKHISINSNLTVVTALPGGGKQLTVAAAMEPATQALLNVTVIQYDRDQRPQEIVFSRRAVYDAPTWRFINAATYHFEADGSTYSSIDPVLRIDVGEAPGQFVRRAAQDNPEDMSRAEIRAVMTSGRLTPDQRRTYAATYHAKLARPFAALVFALIAIPFGLRPVRGGGASLGFGIAVAVVFVYYVIATIFLSLGGTALWLAPLAAWIPNLLFLAI